MVVGKLINFATSALVIGLSMNICQNFTSCKILVLNMGEIVPFQKQFEMISLSLTFKIPIYTDHCDTGSRFLLPQSEGQKTNLAPAGLESRVSR